MKSQVSPFLVFLALLIAMSAGAQVTPAAQPRLDADSWVMIEIWPEVRDITLTAFFLDFSFNRNKNLCIATKRVFDRDQNARAQAADRELSSYRLCLPVPQARAEGYFRPDSDDAGSPR